MIATHWQPSYTPPPMKPVAPLPKIVHNDPPHRRAYIVYGRSKTAQKVYRAIETGDGVSAGDLIGMTKLSGACAYIKTLESDGMIICRLKPVPTAKQRVKHYYPS